MATFDPYRKWLGIPPAEQPPNHYGLLGIGLFESDPDVISNAADRQMVHVRTYQSGKHSAISQRILNELAAARICLLDPGKKAAYDEQLRRQGRLEMSSPPPPPPSPGYGSPPAPPPPAPPLFLEVAAPPVAGEPDDSWLSTGRTRIGSSRTSRPKKSAWQSPAVVITGLLVVCGVLIAWAVSSSLTGQTDGKSGSNGKRIVERPDRDKERRAGERSKTGLPDARTSTQTPTGKEPVGGKVVKGPDRDPALLPKEEGPKPPKVQDPAEKQPPAPPKRVPVPDEAAQGKAEAAIMQDRFKTDFETAVQPATKAALAQKLLDEAAKPQNDAATTFVLLRLARDLDIDLGEPAGQTEKALATIDEIGRRFEIDPFEMKYSALQAMAKATLNLAQRKELAKRIFAVGEAALAADDFKTAELLWNLANAHATKARDYVLAKEAAAAAKEAAQRKEQFQPVQQALDVLRAQPGDPAANLTVGTHYCFVKGDWQKGLPRLAVSADPLLKPLAEKDLAAPKPTAERLALADAWWEVAEKQDPEAQQQVRRHAAAWYEPILADLKGDEKTRAQQRLAEVGDAEAAADSGTARTLAGFGCREDSNKVTLLKTFGGNEASETAVQRALEWLVRHQKTEGNWSFHHATAACRTECPDPGTLDQATHAATALALLPLLGAGHGQRQAKLHKNVLSGLSFLNKRIAAGNGNLHERGVGDMPSHALATLALCEAFPGARDAKTKTSAKAAVKFIIGTQNNDGGWGTKPKLVEPTPDASDTQATGWNLMALRAAQLAGLTVPEKTFRRADHFLDTVAVANKGGYRPTADAKASDPYATAAAILSRMYLGWPREQPELADYVSQVSRARPGPGRFLLNCLNSQVLRDTGGPTWEPWNAALRDRLLATQQTEGHGAGSWFINSGDWGHKTGGRLFCTAMGALILEVYYRYPPLYK